ncbi:MAG TPA: Uma2 family endonuclease, partial [Steroidobacteraceae bacterium]|nr:Uma2 family endonuclease [Steroidobacteraceae bacterium]
DTLLIVEVSETTLRYDREEKMPLYARHGVPEVWIVDVEGKQLHVFRQPSGASYRESLTLDPPGLVSMTALAGVTVDLSQLMR